MLASSTELRKVSRVLRLEPRIGEGLVIRIVAIGTGRRDPGVEAEQEVRVRRERVNVKGSALDGSREGRGLGFAEARISPQGFGHPVTFVQVKRTPGAGAERLPRRDGHFGQDGPFALDDFVDARKRDRLVWRRAEGWTSALEKTSRTGDSSDRMAR